MKYYKKKNYNFYERGDAFILNFQYLGIKSDRYILKSPLPVVSKSVYFFRKNIDDRAKTSFREV